MDQEKIGKFITELRKENNMTQSDLSTRLLTSKENVSRWERGISMPSIEMIMKLSNIFDISVNEFLSGKRKTAINSKEIDTISATLMCDNRRKMRKLIIIFVTIIVILCVFFISLLFYSRNIK